MFQHEIILLTNLLRDADERKSGLDALLDQFEITERCGTGPAIKMEDHLLSTNIPGIAVIAQRREFLAGDLRYCRPVQKISYGSVHSVIRTMPVAGIDREYVRGA
ncbi:hypothetical protein AD953_02780 [Acetobacter malorum]|uniref:Uncharacterized protein n=1 Tax=Acetobacter malorum TaxID=178901 RepID=A0A149VGI2_9PROT|nr:hypothetical protein AD953_02780 [Acetobacter malorum]